MAWFLNTMLIILTCRDIIDNTKVQTKCIELLLKIQGLIAMTMINSFFLFLFGIYICLKVMILWLPHRRALFLMVILSNQLHGIGKTFQGMCNYTEL